MPNSKTGKGSEKPHDEVDATDTDGRDATSVTAASKSDFDAKTANIRRLLRAKLGEDVYSSWFHSLELEGATDTVVEASVPVKFLRNWIQSHYADQLLSCCQHEFPGIERVDLQVRQPSAPPVRPQVLQPAVRHVEPELRQAIARADGSEDANRALAFAAGRTFAAGVEGSPLDSRYTFASFVVGAANRMAHAAATQVAETVFSERHGFNPLYIHSSVGLGKTHLLHAIAWEVKRRSPQASLLYLTAEKFRYQFVEALQSKDSLAFKERFRSIDMLLIDDLEFLHGTATEQEFDHIINTLLDGGRQVVVASARPANQIERLSDRMRSRLQRGLVTEVSAPDYELRLGILEKRMVEKRLQDPSFEVGRDVLELLAERLTENGRELEGAATRLHAHWQIMKTPITASEADAILRDLVQSGENRRIRIEDILKVVSRHYGVPKIEILSQRRHRSVVWPRQIGMYLAKQLTQRSLPEIGRRFGNRDHTTVLHAIRKIEGEISNNPRLKDEIEDLKKLLSV